MTYVAPVADMLFALRELARHEDIASLPGCEEFDIEVVRSVLEEGGKFASEVLAPLNAVGDAEGARLQDGSVVTPPGFAAAYRKFAQAGWTALAGPTDYGGQGMPQLVATAVNELWAGANLAFSLCPLASENAVATLLRHAPEALRKRYLERIVTGEWTAPMALTEPQAGSDLTLLRTRARPDGDAYRISGTKIFITYGEHDWTENIVHLVLARLPGAPEGTRGISLFLVPKFLVEADGSLGRRNDVHCVSIEHKLGIRASPTCVMAYGANEGAVGYLVGEPNRGLEAMFVMMNRMRLGVGVEGLALAGRAYQKARAYAAERLQGAPADRSSRGPVPILRHPDVRRMLASMKAQIEAMRGLSYYAAARMDIAARHPSREARAAAQSLVELLTPVIKGWQTEQAQEVVSMALQIHGGSGFVEETGIAQTVRDARILPIYEATTGIQGLDLVLRKVGRDDGAAMAQLLSEMRKDWGQTPFLQLLDQTTRYIVENHAKEPEHVAAGAVPYLMLVGTVAGAWQLSRAAKADPSRLPLSRFYADHILPRAQVYAHEVMSGAESTLGFTP